MNITQEKPQLNISISIRIIALLLCGSFGLLRLAKADGREGYLISAGLTGIDAVAVEGLIYFAGKRAKLAASYRASRAQIVGLEEAVASTDAQIGAERLRRDGILAALQQREAMAADPKPAADEVAWAVEAAYRGALNANQRILEGGAVEAFSSLAMVQTQEEAL